MATVSGPEVPSKTAGEPIEPAGGATDSTRDSKPLLIGTAISCALLAVLIVLEYKAATSLKVPAQWLAVAAVPVLVGLQLGGYISVTSFFGISGKIELKQAPYVAPGLPVLGQATARSAANSSWTAERDHDYDRTHRLELVHVYRPSKRKEQRFDISIYLVRHVSGGEPNQSQGFTEISKAEFFFGPSWGDQVFEVANNGAVIGINTSRARAGEAGEIESSLARAGQAAVPARWVRSSMAAW